MDRIYYTIIIKNCSLEMIWMKLLLHQSPSKNDDKHSAICKILNKEV